MAILSAGLFTSCSDFLPKSLYKACVLFVNDGSRDDSLLKIKEICSRHEDFFYISFVKNAGLSAAVKAGFDHSFQFHNS